MEANYSVRTDDTEPYQNNISDSTHNKIAERDVRPTYTGINKYRPTPRTSDLFIFAREKTFLSSFDCFSTSSHLLSSICKGSKEGAFEVYISSEPLD